MIWAVGGYTMPAWPPKEYSIGETIPSGPELRQKYKGSIQIYEGVRGERLAATL